MTQNAGASGDARAIFAHARECEQRGLFADAVRGYLAAGAVEHAAQVLARTGRFFDAAHLLLSLVRTDPASDPESARLARNAAACLAHGGDREGAAEIMRRLAAVERPSLTPSGVAVRQGADAAIEIANAEAYRLGATRIRAGALREGLDALVTISQTSAHYRNACAYAIHASCKLQDISFAMDNFIAPFARSDPRDTNEAQALVALGELYSQQGFAEEARECYERVLRLMPGDAIVRQKLADLAAVARPEPPGAPHSLEESVSFWSERKQPPDATDTTPVSPRVARAKDVAIRSGVLIADRYVIEEELGRGGMGIVFAATDKDLGERVAIKSFLNRVDDQNVIARFKQELSVSRKLSHDNIIRLHDMGVHDGRLFLTMELLAGKTLKQSVPDMGFRQRLVTLSQLCVGVAAIHERDVVHRDLKPANIFITERGVLKIMDFGLAKLTSTAAEGLTGSGFAAGTPGYMPPEQVMSFGTVSASADVYAVGVIAYEMLAGHRPFRHADASQIIRLQFTTEPTSIRAAVPDLPADLDTVVLRLLDKDPERRASLSELDATIRKVLSASP